MSTTDPHSFCDPSQGRITHLDFSITPDFEARVVRIRTTYHLDRLVQGSLFLDSKGLAIHQVHCPGADLRWSFDRADPLLGQRLHLMDLPGIETFAIESTTSAEAAALQWLRPEQTQGKVHPYLYTQCQACAARSLFPCQDTPGVRFTYEAELEVEPPLAGVMGAEPMDILRQAGRDRYRFVMGQSVPSYLFAFAVGHLAFREIGPRTGVYAEPEIVEEAAWEFAQNEDVLTAGEALFGPYRWDRYDLLMIPPAFPYGGMENPRLTFLNASYVRGDRSGTWLIAHELAHAWTGNLVTNATWNDFWLNEGPTTYAESRISEVIEGRAMAELRTAGRARTLLRDIERLGSDSPMTCLRLDLAGMDPDESYSNIPYFKGLLFFRSLEREVGREAFDVFLRRYIDDHTFQSIDSDEFLAYLESHLPAATTRVDARRWIFDPGLPDGAADIPSELRNDILAVVEAYRRGERPTPERIASWSNLQKTVFVSSLLPRTSPEDCGYFDQLLGIGETRDGDLFCRFCELSLGSGYEEILPRYEAFFASVGRYSVHQYVFRAMVANEWSRARARPLFERNRAFHHPHTVAAIERILTQGGL